MAGIVRRNVKLQCGQLINGGMPFMVLTFDLACHKLPGTLHILCMHCMYTNVQSVCIIVTCIPRHEERQHLCI